MLPDGPVSDKLLEEHLASGDPHRIIDGLICLATGGNDPDSEADWRPVVVCLLGNPNPEVSSAASAALLRFSSIPDDCLEAAGHVLGSASTEVERAVLESIRPRQLSVSDSAIAVIRCLRDEDYNVWMSALQLLWFTFADQDNLPSLLNCQQRYAERARGGIGPDHKAFGILIASASGTMAVADLEAQLDCGPGFDALVKAIASGLLFARACNLLKKIRRSPSDRDRGTVSLTLAPAADAFDSLCELINDSSDDVRLAAATSFRSISRPSPSILRQIENRLSDESAAVRRVSASTLASYGRSSQSSLPILANVIAQDQDRQTRMAAAVAFYQIMRRSDIEEIPALASIADSLAQGIANAEDDEVLSLTILALSALRQGARPALGALLKSLTKTTRMRGVILSLVVSLGPSEVEGASAALELCTQDSDATLRKLAYEAAESILGDNEESRRILTEGLADSDSQVQLAAAVGLSRRNLNTAEAVRLLTRLARDDRLSAEIRLSAAAILRENQHSD